MKQFGSNLCKILDVADVDKSVLAKFDKQIGNVSGESQIEDYFKTLLKLAQQGA